MKRIPIGNLSLLQLQCLYTLYIRATGKEYGFRSRRNRLEWWTGTMPILYRCSALPHPPPDEKYCVAVEDYLYRVGVKALEVLYSERRLIQKRQKTPGFCEWRIRESAYRALARSRPVIRL